MDDTVKLPVVYSEAVRALQVCLSLDEAKHWADRAEALAAWAKIYRVDSAGRAARQLKLHAFRRMGALAAELRPKKVIAGGGSPPGPISALLEQGLTTNAAQAARHLAVMGAESFQRLVNLPRPPTPSSVYFVNARARAPHREAVAAFRGFVRGHSPDEFISSIRDDVEWWRQSVTEIAEWIDRVDQFLGGLG